MATSFPKSVRLLHREDFFFSRWFRYYSDHFLCIFSVEGKGRIGISISKKVLRKSHQRNRVRRLIREAFRHQQGDFLGIDLHIIGRDGLSGKWDRFRRADFDAMFKGIAVAARSKCGDNLHPTVGANPPLAAGR